MRNVSPAFLADFVHYRPRALVPPQAVAKPQVDNIINGFNGCCFAYGQTGSGESTGNYKRKNGVERHCQHEHHIAYKKRHSKSKL